MCCGESRRHRPHTPSNKYTAMCTAVPIILINRHSTILKIVVVRGTIRSFARPAAAIALVPTFAAAPPPFNMQAAGSRCCPLVAGLGWRRLASTAASTRPAARKRQLLPDDVPSLGQFMGGQVEMPSVPAEQAAVAAATGRLFHVQTYGCQVRSGSAGSREQECHYPFLSIVYEISTCIHISVSGICYEHKCKILDIDDYHKQPG